MTKSFRYVKDFEFPSEAGYTGSCGKTTTKGYARGGNVAAPKTPAPTATPANAHGKATSAAAHARNDARKASKVAPVAAKPAAPAMPGKPAIAAKQAMMCGGKVMKKAEGGKVMKKAEGGDVTYNEAGQKLYVSRPSVTAPPAAIPAPAQPTRRRPVKIRKPKLTRDQKQAEEEAQNARRREYFAQKKAAMAAGTALPDRAMLRAPTETVARKAGGAVRKSYPTNKSQPLIPGKKMK